MRRLTIMLAAAAALLLLPAASAFALDTVTIEVEGVEGGSGEVSSAGGYFGFYEGVDPVTEAPKPIECSGPPTAGVCTTGIRDEGEGVEGLMMHVNPAPGSKFLEFVVLEGESPNVTPNFPEEGYEFYNQQPGAGNVKIRAVFEGEETGPTNRATLTITKSPAPNAGSGTGLVLSKPKGIKCAAACSESVASLYKQTPVTLTAKPSSEDSFVEWTGACSGASLTCTVPMAGNESVGAVFSGPSKAFSPAEALTLAKAEGSSGYGTVIAAGLACEADCTETTVLYQGPPKAKTVILKEVPAFGSEFSGWSGCDSNPTPGECSVTMEAAKEVTASFTAKPTTTLTVNKAGTGSGTVTSKPKALNCGATCTTQDATVPVGAEVILKEKPGLGMSFEGWTGACTGSGETCTVTLAEAGTVTAKFGGTAKAIANPQPLTLTKAGSGYGTIKAAGMVCEALCSSTVSLYQGPPKAKTVTLKATSAPGSKAVEWTGCESNPTASECVVVMSEAKEVTAKFDELE